MLKCPGKSAFTMTGIGHAYTTGQSFPSPDIQLTSTKLLPERLEVDSSNFVTVLVVFNTSY